MFELNALTMLTVECSDNLRGGGVTGSENEHAHEARSPDCIGFYEPSMIPKRSLV